jgi:hypothetical protein
VIILAGRLDRSLLKAIRYAKSIDATEIRAVHAAVDPHQAQELLERWTEVGHQLGIPLDVEESFDRDIVRSIRMSLNRSRDGVSQITVVLPRRVYPHVLQRLLHDHTARTLAHGLDSDGDVEVVMVPYRFGASTAQAGSTEPERADGDQAPTPGAPSGGPMVTEPLPSASQQTPAPVSRR